jgi:predicted component of type VI protein secretion system
MAKLVLLSEGFAGTTFELKVERTSVGRMEDNGIQIAEPSVSSHHCEIVLRGAEVVVRDLNSTNGTYINGNATKEAVLKPGAVLRLGAVEMRLEAAAGGAPGTPGPAPGAAPPASASKKVQDHTALLPGGVKLTELEQGGRALGSSPFAKKSDKANKVFLYVGIVLAVLILCFIVYSVLNLGG